MKALENRKHKLLLVENKVIHLRFASHTDVASARSTPADAQRDDSSVPISSRLLAVHANCLITPIIFV